MVEEVTAYKTAMGKLCDTKEEAEKEELKEMEEEFIRETARLIFPTRSQYANGEVNLNDFERGVLIHIFRYQEELKPLLEKYNIYE